MYTIMPPFEKGWAYCLANVGQCGSQSLYQYVCLQQLLQPTNNWKIFTF